MRKIATFLAVTFAMLGAFANIHMAAAHAAQLSKQKHTETISLAANKVERPKATPPVAPAPVVVTVAPGDTLYGIATANGTTYVRMYDANNTISDPNLIFPGQQLTVPASNEQLPDRSPPIPAEPAAAPAASYTETDAPAPVPTPTPTAVLTAATTDGSGTAAAKAYIYMHESGDNPNSTSASGCYGLGQDCSGRVRALCGNDYACQDEWFTNYANSRYGGWSGAEAFWQSHRWW